MADPNQEQSQTPAPTETVTTPVETTQTLADVAKKYNVDQQVQNFTAQPQQPQYQPTYPAAPPFTPPDPVTAPEQWNQYQANILMQNQNLQGNLRELTQTVQAIRQEATQAKLDTEVNQAVHKVNERLKVDPLYAEIALEKRYRDDPIFKRIWDNRNVNPKALEEALGVISNELQGVFSVRQDPQLTENLRAAKQSQRTMSTTQRSSQNDDVMNMSEGDFDRWWNQQKSRG